MTTDDRYDLVVVGAGPAGICCAVTAARRGVRVLLLDKADDVGGTLHVSGGHLSAAGTRRQHERGIDDTPATHHDDVRRISHGTARDDLVALAVAHAATTVDWLQDEGFDFAPETPRIVHGHEPYAVPRTYYGPEQGRSVLAVLRRVLADTLAAGAPLHLWRAARAVRLRRDGDRVTGVDVHRDGVEVPVTAADVVLATGGYAADADLVGELERMPLFSAAWPTSTGDGLRMARDVGAAVAGTGHYLPTFGGLSPERDGGQIRWADRPLLVATERPPWEVYVDRHGRRFVAEDATSIDAKERALMGVDGMTFWTVFDSAGLAASRPVVIGWSVEDLLAAADRRPGIHRADTLDELAGRAGIDPAGLLSTVDDYNAALATGAADPFGRRHRPAPIARPPFLAVRNHGVTLISFAGVDVDDRLRVRRADGSVLPGLWAAGEVVGAAATTGNAFCGGMLLTPALTFGRLLGARLGPG